MALPTPFLRAGALIGATAALGAFSSYRFTRAGQWLPPMPDNVGYWNGIEAPLPQNTLALLGNPIASGRNYTNPFGEVVQASLVAAGPFENYHDPTVCVTGGGYDLTAVKEIPIDGASSGQCRALVFKQSGGGDKAIRILMYYWQQNRDGSTASEARMGSYRDIVPRLQTGYGAVVQGHQTVLVRIYTIILPDDPDGIRAQRNVDTIAKAVYRSLIQSGTGGGHS